MRNLLYPLLVIALISVFFGCGRKQEPLEEMQEPISMEELTRTSVNVKPQVPGAIVRGSPEAPLSAQTTDTISPAVFLPPAGSYKPSAREIQQALSNAGFNIGRVDGKIGPMTKKAIEEFQKANNLKADGKVGPQTWAVLGTYLNKSSSQ